MTFFEKVYEVVKSIPKGKVMTYGAVAAACGNPKMARQVGWALHANPSPGTIPCHRVVNKAGFPSEAFAFGGSQIQVELLVAEGVEFVDGHVDMQKHNINLL
jgi:methylated-DNA-protein-cysteine methyltransferase-like protein